MKIYVAYGSNMNIKQMNKRCPNAVYKGIGMLKDYKLTFRGEGHANIVRAEGIDLPVVLWSITEECEKALDIYETYPDYYIKENIEVLFEKDKIEGMVYIMSKEKENILIEPTEEYFNTILEAYKEQELDFNNLMMFLEENKKENKI